MKQEWEAYWDNYRFPDHFMQSDAEPFNNPVRVMISKIVEKSNSESVLDVGCASAISYPLFKNFYVGVDFTLAFLKAGKKKYPDVPAVLGYNLQLPFKDKAFDAVFIKDVLEHLGPDDYKKVIAEMWRVTNSIMILVFYGDLNRPTKYEQLREPDEHNIGVPAYSGGTYFFNRYGEEDITFAVGRLPYLDGWEIIRNIPRENCPEDKIGRTVVVAVKQYELP